MKITSILIMKDSETDPIILANAMDLTSFGYFQRGTVKEMMVFVSRTIAKRTPPGRRQSVEHEGEAGTSSSCPRLSCHSGEDTWGTARQSPRRAGQCPQEEVAEQGRF